jgi:hypothetical protein
MSSNPSALIACESVLDPILERLTMVLDEHSVNFAGPVAEALQRLQSTAADTSVTISAAILETLGPVSPRCRWALVGRARSCSGGAIKCAESNVTVGSILGEEAKSPGAAGEGWPT